MRVSNKFWTGVWNALLIQLMVIVLIMSTMDSAHATKKPYHEHPKYRWVFCQITPIPLKWCNRGRGRP